MSNDDPCQPTATRRATLATAGGLLAGAGVARGVATVATADHGVAKPDHVTLSYDQDLLEQYQPYVVIPTGAEIRPTEWKAWTATSPEYDYDVHVYFLYWQSQVTGRSADSHRRDREPIYVFADRETGEVRETAYTAYHWFRYRERHPPTYIPDSGDEEHPTFEVVNPWHHYLQTGDAGEAFPVEPLGTADGDPFATDKQTTYEQWLDTGWEADLHPGAVQNPALMLYRDTWWRDGQESTLRTIWSLQISLAQYGFVPSAVLGGAGQTDFVRTT